MYSMDFSNLSVFIVQRICLVSSSYFIDFEAVSVQKYLSNKYARLLERSHIAVTSDITHIGYYKM